MEQEKESKNSRDKTESVPAVKAVERGSGHSNQGHYLMVGDKELISETGHATGHEAK